MDSYALQPGLQESACQIVKSVGDSAVLQQITLEGLSFAKNIKGSRKQGQIIRCSNKDNGSDRGMNIHGKQNKR